MEIKVVAKFKSYGPNGTHIWGNRYAVIKEHIYSTGRSRFYLECYYPGGKIFHRDSCLRKEGIIARLNNSDCVSQGYGWEKAFNVPVFTV